MCPGRLLADSTIFLTIAQSLAVFEIGKAIEGASDKIIEPVIGTTAGLVAHPLPFKCRIVPRSEKHAIMIRAFGAEDPWEDGGAKLLKGVSG